MAINKSKASLGGSTAYRLASQAHENQRMIEKVTEAIVSVEGENLREKTLVLLEEVKSSDWGIGGKTLTAYDVSACEQGSSLIHHMRMLTLEE